MKTSLFLILLPVLVGFIINGLLAFKKQDDAHGHSTPLYGIIASVSVFLSFLVVSLNTYELSQMISFTGDIHFLESLFTWFSIDGLSVSLNLRLDKISAIMCMVITGVGTLIHIYSIGYMAHDKSSPRYFAYLNLFVFFMLILVLGDSLPVMFIGWEGVGLCSYLLIGFWYAENKNVDAANKAFIVNRVGDFAFLLGMFIIYNQFGTLTFSEINSASSSLAVGASFFLALASVLLFVGATGKSAQVPLYVWLPDAMAGPTPVSALIHAATMVTAGVYMLVRLHPLFLLSPMVMQTIALIGCLTAFMAATMALVQNDIKKVLAYSTISQLGFMFMACGVGAFNTAMFHLVTHAFFKALLFLGAGSVIHACSGIQDMLKMGALRKSLPHTHFVMLIGAFALSGLPPFAGFFSKDEILYSVLSLPMGNIPMYIVVQAIALLTALYSARMLVLTFYGTSRLPKDSLEHLHESPWIMVVPLYALAFLTLIAGSFGLPHYLNSVGLHIPHFLNSWLSADVIIQQLPEVSSVGLNEAAVSMISLFLGVMTFAFSCILFLRIVSISEIPLLRIPARVWSDLYCIDQYYQKIIVHPLRQFSNWLYRKVDRVVIDGFANGCGQLFLSTAKTFKVIHNGHTQTYALLIVGGFLIALFLLNFIFP